MRHTKKKQKPEKGTRLNPPIESLNSSKPQTKLKIGAPNDKYEQQADAVADAVVANPSPAAVQTMPMEKEEGRQMMPEEEESVQMIPEDEESVQMMPEDEESVQMMPEDEEVQMMSEDEEVQAKPGIQKSADGSSQASSTLASQLGNSKGGGQSLPSNVQREMGHKIGVDFSGVKIHNNSQSAEMNGSIGARAFTHGSDIYFNKGEYNPDSQSGKHLLAHELTHTVQQNKEINKVQKKDDPPQGNTQQVAQIAPINVGGDLTSKKIIRIAWTLDDGPTNVTQLMEQNLGVAKAATWFIMRNQLQNDTTKKLKALLKIQNVAKGEIAIHSMHPTKTHVSWFRSSYKNTYTSIATAMSDLKSFYKYLKVAGINAKFVRLPYGLHSELHSYLKLEGYNNYTSRDKVARAIIAGKNVTGKAIKVKADFDAMTATLTGLGLHLWGGSGSGGREISPNSWEAESSGTKLTDNITSHNTNNPTSKNKGRFEKTVDLVLSSGVNRSLIVLAHDTKSPNATEVGKDVSVMDAYAKKKGVKIEYHTMSSLFKIKRGVAP